jgi:hypothetical protein
MTGDVWLALAGGGMLGRVAGRPGFAATMSPGSPDRSQRGTGSYI